MGTMIGRAGLREVSTRLFAFRTFSDEYSSHWKHDLYKYNCLVDVTETKIEYVAVVPLPLLPAPTPTARVACDRPASRA